MDQWPRPQQQQPGPTPWQAQPMMAGGASPPGGALPGISDPAALPGMQMQAGALSTPGNPANAEQAKQALAQLLGGQRGAPAAPTGYAP